MEMQLLGIGRVASRTKHGSAVIWHQDVASKLLPGSSMEIQLLGIRTVAAKPQHGNAAIGHQEGGCQDQAKESIF